MNEKYLEMKRTAERSIKGAIPAFKAGFWWVWWVRKGDGRVFGGSVDSGCHKLSENIWFVWSRTPYSGEKVGCDA